MERAIKVCNILLFELVFSITLFMQFHFSKSGSDSILSTPINNAIPKVLDKKEPFYQM